MPLMRPDSMFPAGVKLIAAYRAEGEVDGDGEHPREGDDAGSWRHGQDRPPGGGEARGTRPAGADRLSLRRDAVRLGKAGHVGIRAGWRERGVRLLLPGPGDSRSPRSGARVRRTRGTKRRSEVGIALGPGRRGGPKRRAGPDGSGGRGRYRVDDRALRLVHAELRRELPDRADPRRRGYPLVRPRPRAFRGRW